MERITIYGTRTGLTSPTFNMDSWERLFTSDSNHTWDRDIADLDIRDAYEDAVFDFMHEYTSEIFTKVKTDLETGKLKFPGLSSDRLSKGFKGINIKFVLYDPKSSNGEKVHGIATFTPGLTGIDDINITIGLSGAQNLRETYITLGHELRHLTQDNIDLGAGTLQERDAESYGIWLASQYGY